MPHHPGLSHSFRNCFPLISGDQSLLSSLILERFLALQLQMHHYTYCVIDKFQSGTEAILPLEAVATGWFMGMQ